MNDFTIEELREMVNSLAEVLDWGQARDESMAADLKRRFEEKLREAEELENMDLSDCAGGACKL